MLLPLRSVTCFAPPLQAIFAPCGPLMGVLTVMHFSHVLLFQYRHFCPPPPSPQRGPLMGVLPAMQFSHVLPLHYRQGCPLWAVDAILPPVGRLVVVLPARQPCPLWAFLVSCPFRRQPCPLRALWWVVLSEGSHALCGACGGLSSPWSSFAPCGTLH